MPLSSRIRRRRITYGSGPVVPVPTGKTAPASPTSVFVLGRILELAVTWTAPVSNGGSPITDYLVDYSTNNGSTWTNFVHPASTATSLTITGLTFNTYTVRVSAKNAIGRSGGTLGDASVIVASVPDPPTSVVAATGNAQLTVTWLAPEMTGGDPINDYQVQYSSNSGSTWTIFTDPVSTATSCTITGLTNGTSYVVRVLAKTGIGMSLPSANSVTSTLAVPGAPTSVIVTPGNAQLAVTWTAPASTGGSPITDYLVKYSSNGGSTWTNFVHSASAATSRTVTGLTNGVSYVIKVIAQNAVGIGLPSANSAAKIPFFIAPTIPGAPTSVSVSGATNLTVTWTAPVSTGGSPIIDYLIYQYKDVNYNRLESVGHSTATSITLTGLTNGTYYAYKVYARNAVGYSVESEISAWIQTTTNPAPTIPGSPTSVKASNPLSGQLLVNWTAPSSTGNTPITNYLVYYSSNSGSTWTNFVRPASTVAGAVVTGLTNGTAYVFRVIAVNVVGNSSPSANSAPATPAVPVVVVPPPVQYIFDVAYIQLLLASPLPSLSTSIVTTNSAPGQYGNLYFPTSNPNVVTSDGLPRVWQGYLYPARLNESKYPLAVLHSRSSKWCVWGAVVTRYSTKPEAGWTAEISFGQLDTQGGVLMPPQQLPYITQTIPAATGPKAAYGQNPPTNFQNTPYTYKIYESGSYNVPLTKVTGLQHGSRYYIMDDYCLEQNVQYYLTVRFISPDKQYVSTPGYTTVAWANEWDASPTNPVYPFG